MKIKIKISGTTGPFCEGSIVDAAVDENQNLAFFFGRNSEQYWLYSGQFEVVKEELVPNEQKEKAIFSLRELLGQDVKLVEFK